MCNVRPMLSEIVNFIFGFANLPSEKSESNLILFTAKSLAIVTNVGYTLKYDIYKTRNKGACFCGVLH